MKKRLLCAFLALILAVGFSGCGLIEKIIDNPFIDETESPTSERGEINTGTVPTVSDPVTEEPENTEPQIPARTEAVEWTSDTHALVMVTVDEGHLAMKSYSVTFYGKMGDVYKMTDVPVEIPAGDYTVVVESDGFLPYREDITVIPGEIIDLDNFEEFEFISEEEVTDPFRCDTVVVTEEYAYSSKTDGVYRIGTRTVFDDVTGREFIFEDTVLIFSGEFRVSERLATDGRLLYIVDVHSNLWEIQLESLTSRIVTSDLPAGAEICSADRNYLYVSTPETIDYNDPSMPGSWASVVRISLNNGELTSMGESITGECFGGYTCIQEFAFDVSPRDVAVYDENGDLFLEVPLAWSVSVLNGKLCVVELENWESGPISVYTYDGETKTYLYEITDLEPYFILFCRMNDCIFTYGYSNEDVSIAFEYVDLSGEVPVDMETYPNGSSNWSDIKEYNGQLYFIGSDMVYTDNNGYLTGLWYLYEELGYGECFFYSNMMIYEPYDSEFVVFEFPAA
ncbi:MAG: hypothetical protein IKZ19_07030 [Clostridia bacterium]|nr:hypothetical protein [Clostridia bacterium]